MEDAALRTIARLDGTPFPSTLRLVSGWLHGRVPGRSRRAHDTDLGTAYCAEIVALTYQAMGLLPKGRRPSWYDAGRFWSGDDLTLTSGSRLGGEIEVQVPVQTPAATPDSRWKLGIRRRVPWLGMSSLRCDADIGRVDRRGYRAHVRCHVPNIGFSYLGAFALM